MNDVKRQSQLLEQLDITEKQSMMCHELARTLHERLSGVLRPELPLPQASARVQPVQDALVPAAERVRACGSNCVAALNVLQSILERLEA